jgi:hypothetical protein
MAGQKIISYDGMCLDLANQYHQPSMAKFIKNLTYLLSDNADGGTSQGTDKGVMKPLQGNAIYSPIFLPAGNNYIIGNFSSKQTNEVYLFVYNSQKNHLIYRINGLLQTAQIVKIDPCLNFIYSPEYFIGEGQCWLEINKYTDPLTGLELTKKDLYWTDGKNYQGFIRVDDSIATNGFDKSQNSYFAGTYDPCELIRVGLPTPKKCMSVNEVAHTSADVGLNNQLLFKGWQFRILDVDVFGRPSEHGIISDLYLPGINDCFSGSANLSRCLDLVFDAGNPFVDKKQIEYTTDNGIEWTVTETIDLYVGNSLGEWWKRTRNPNVKYDANSNKITYRFCDTGQCIIVDPAETNKLQPALARSSQSVFKIGNKIGFANNKEGFNPIPKALKDSITFQINPSTVGAPKLRSITILCPIWSIAYNDWQQVIKYNNKYCFGGMTLTNLGTAANPRNYALDTANPINYQQFFANANQQGFQGYLVGAGSVISTQVYVDAAGNLIDDTNFNGINLSPLGLTFQKFVFNNVAAGNYIFRISSHKTDPNTAVDITKTSTTVYGLCDFNSAGFLINPNARNVTQELFINACDGDYTSLKDNKVLTILDASGTMHGSQSWKSKSGYVTSGATATIATQPVELVKITSGEGTNSVITDHNGFYWLTTRSGGTNINFNFQLNCGNSSISQGTNVFAGMTNTDIIISTYAPQFAGFTTQPCNNILVSGRIVLADKNIGVPNVVVVLTRGQSALTDNQGYYSIIAHDDNNATVRNDNVVIVSSGCDYTSITGGCVLPVAITITKCVNCAIRGINFVNFSLVYQSLRGLLSGGTYPVFANLYDYLGRKGYSQYLGDLSIPSIIQSQSISPSSISVTIPSTSVFPPETSYMVISIGAETTIDTYLDWIVDQVQFIDNSGNINNEAPTQIKIYYGSIIEFSKQNNFNTTTAWQFLVATTTNAEISDKVQFFINGDGKFFATTIIGLVKYDQNGQYFLIDYTSDLKDLKANAYIRLIRPKVCVGNEPNYEICSSQIDIVNQHATINNLVLNAFDTYYLTRQIPVPVAQVTVPVTYINQLRSFGFKFEHHSPSNFWGYKVWNRGRLNVKNPYETILIKENQIALSGAASSTGQLNYQNNFDESGKVDLLLTNSGGIVYVKPKQGIVFVICQFNYFTIGYGDNLPRVVNGQLQVPSAIDSFGKPERGVGMEYGCLLFDKSTIREQDGKIHFLDSNNIAVVRSDFSKCEDVSSNKDNIQRKSTILSWLTKKVNYIKNYNLTNANKIYFHAVVNPVSHEYLLSDFDLFGTSYVNNERCLDVTKHETISFDTVAQIWKEFISPTPEYWANLENELNGNQLFSFKNAIPYFHYTTTNIDKSCVPLASSGNGLFNTFFGVSCNRVFEFAFALDPFDKKFFKNISVYCPQSLYFADRILTETNQESRLLLSQFEKANYFSFAAFLTDINTPVDANNPNQDMLIDGNSLTGTWIQIRLIGEPAKDNVFSELFGVIVEVEKQNKSGA